MNSINEEINKKVKFLELAKEIGNITKAARLMGYHVSTYYNLKKIYDKKGKEGFIQHLREGKKVIEEIENEVLKIVTIFPKFSAERISRELKIKNIKVSTGSVHTILKKYNLNTSKQRLEKLKNDSKTE